MGNPFGGCVSLAVPEGMPVKTAEDAVVAYVGNEVKATATIMKVYAVTSHERACVS